MGSSALLWLALPLALAGTLLNGLGALWQNTAVQADLTGHIVRLATLRRLVRNRRWLLGQSAVVAGSVLHFGALAFAPVTVVQPLGVLAVAVTAVASARVQGTRLDVGSMLALVAVVAGVGGFTALAASNATVTRVSDQTALLIALVVAGILLVLCVIGWLGRGWLRCIAFASCSGVLFGFASVVVRLAALSIHSGSYADFPLGSLIGLVIAIPAAIWFIQQAHASGPPDVVVAALTLVDPVVAVGIGYVALGEGAQTYTIATIGEVVCFFVAAIGIVVLSKYRRKPPLPTVAAGHVGTRSTERT